LTAPLTFDAGVFIIMLALGAVCIIASIKMGPVFKLLGAILFFTLGTVLLAGYDVQSTKITTDGTTTINETSYLIGNGAVDKNNTSSFLGWIFIVIGIAASFMFFTELISSV
jgi:hypothetical protein